MLTGIGLEFKIFTTETPPPPPPPPMLRVKLSIGKR